MFPLPTQRVPVCRRALPLFCHAPLHGPHHSRSHLVQNMALQRVICLLAVFWHSTSQEQIVLLRQGAVKGVSFQPLKPRHFYFQTLRVIGFF